MKFGLKALFVVLTLACIGSAFPLVAIATLVLAGYIAFVALLLIAIEQVVGVAISVAARIYRPRWPRRSAALPLSGSKHTRVDGPPRKFYDEE